MWTQSKEITGVSGASSVELKALIAQERQNAKGPTAKPVTKLNISKQPPRGGMNAIPGPTNRGVQDRDQRDQYAEESEQQDRVNNLAMKEEMYNQFMAGDRRGPVGNFRRGEMLVDFEKKQMDAYELDRRREEEMDGRDRESQFYHPDIQREEERRRWEQRHAAEAREAEADSAKAREKRDILAQLVDETQVGREKHRQLLLKRKHAQMTRLELLKQKAQTKAHSSEASEPPAEELPAEDAEVDTPPSKRPKLGDKDEETAE